MKVSLFVTGIGYRMVENGIIRTVAASCSGILDVVPCDVLESDFSHVT